MLILPSYLTLQKLTATMHKESSAKFKGIKLCVNILQLQADTEKHEKFPCPRARGTRLLGIYHAVIFVLG